MDQREERTDGICEQNDTLRGESYWQKVNCQIEARTQDAQRDTDSKVTILPSDPPISLLWVSLVLLHLNWNWSTNHFWEWSINISFSTFLQFCSRLRENETLHVTNLTTLNKQSLDWKGWPSFKVYYLISPAILQSYLFSTFYWSNWFWVITRNNSWVQKKCTIEA